MRLLDHVFDHVIYYLIIMALQLHFLVAMSSVERIIIQLVA